MLGRALAMAWMYAANFLKAAICVIGNVSGWQGLSPLVHTSSAYQVLGVAFIQPVIILHVSFRAVLTCIVCLERIHEEQANLAVENVLHNANYCFIINKECSLHLEWRCLPVFAVVVVFR